MSDFGELLDEVLREAANLPPLVGMERRLFAGLSGGANGSRGAVWVGAAVAAALLIGVAVWPLVRPQAATSLARVTEGVAPKRSKDRTW